MKNRIFLIAAVTAILLLAFASVGSGAASAATPGTMGQPGQECGSATAANMPAGFGTSGFATAEGVYAGSDGTPSAANGDSHAVSQYDVACFQLTSSGNGVPAT